MSSDETTSNKKLPAAPERMGRDAIHELERMELLKLIAATLNALYYERPKYDDISLHPFDLCLAIDSLRGSSYRCNDFNEVYDFLRISDDIIQQLNRFKKNIEQMMQSILYFNKLRVKDGVIAIRSTASLEDTK